MCEIPSWLPLFCQGQADQSARMADHEIDGLRRHEFRRKQQIPLVLAVLFVDQDDHATGAYLVDDLGYRCDVCHVCGSIGVAQNSGRRILTPTATFLVASVGTQRMHAASSIHCILPTRDIKHE